MELLFFDDFILTAIILLSLVFIYQFFAPATQNSPIDAQQLFTEAESAAADARRAARIAADNWECSICLEACVFGVVTSCNHSYCSCCWIELTRHSGERICKCPNDRRAVTLILELWTPEERNLLNSPYTPRSRPFDRNRPTAADAHEFYIGIQEYNDRAKSAANASGSSFHSIRESIRDAPTFLRALRAEAFSSFGGFCRVLLRVKIVLSFFFGFLYILLPFDFIPEFLFGAVGYIDDIFVALVIAVYVANTFKGIIQEGQQRRGVNYQRRREREAT